MASTGETWRLGRRPELDALRGIAVLLVLLSHLNVPLFQGAGQVGVTVFFTLSGFLIATLLFEELEDRGRVNLRRFYVRRARRLLPALLGMVAAALLLGALGVIPMLTGWQATGALLYCSNILHALGIPGRGGPVTHTWTLAIEEQFYLVFPLLLIALARHRRAFLCVLTLAGLGSGAWRVALWAQGEPFARYIAGTDARLDGIVLGCAFAAFMRGRRPVQMPRWVVPVSIAACLIPCAVYWGPVWVPGLTVVSFATVAMLAAIIGGTSGDALLCSRPLRLLGRRSYGFYLWHGLALWVASGLGLDHSRLMFAAFVVPVSVVATELSWRYLEQPFLRASSTSRQPAEFRPAPTVAAGTAA